MILLLLAIAVALIGHAVAGSLGAGIGLFLVAALWFAAEMADPLRR